MATFGKTPPRDGEELDHLLDLPAPERDALMVNTLKAMPVERLTVPRKNGKTGLLVGTLDEMPVATSDPESLIEDMKPPFKTLLGFPVAIDDQPFDEPDLVFGRWETPAERFERISQARRDDAALPQTRFGDYPSE